MPFHLFVGGEGERSERPDHVLERVFDFFDSNPDVPFVVVSSADSLSERDAKRPEGTPPLVRDGYYVPEMPDSSALLVLARRERVDRIRPYVFDDFTGDGTNAEELNKRGVARRLFLAYNDLERKVGVPNVDEWLKEAAAFAKREDIYPKDRSFLDAVHKGHHPPRDFRPTPWFPIPWNKDQLEAFDALPTLGFIHRPVFVKTVDEHGKPLERRDARTAALAAGWKQALLTVPESERKKAPGHLIAATSGNVDQLVALHSIMSGWAAEGGPELDSSKPTKWIDTDARLGNTGAATWFVQMAIGVMGSYLEGGTSVAINLRDPKEASVVFIEPPPPEKIKAQASRDVFKHNVAPAINPANYK